MSHSDVEREGIYFENAVRLSTQMGDYLIQLRELAESKGGITARANQLKIAALAHRLDEICKETERTELGGELHILTPIFRSMALVASLASSGMISGRFALAIYIASIGIGDSKSQLRLIGPILNRLGNKIAQGMLLYTPKVEMAKKELFSEMTILALSAGMMAISTIIDQRGEEKAPFDVEMMLVMALNSGFIEVIAQGITEMITGEGEAQKTLAAAISSTAVLLMIEMAAKRSKSERVSLIELVKSPLTKWLKQVNAHVNNHLEVHEVNGKREGKMVAFIQRALLTLEREDIESFSGILTERLEEEGISYDQLQADIGDLAELTKTLVDGWLIRKQTIGHMGAGIFSG